jgi:hypothetical protein
VKNGSCPPHRHRHAVLVSRNDLITATVPLEQAEAAFRALTAPGNDQLKVLLAP